MLSIFSCACWPSVYLLWKIVYLGFLPIFWFFFSLLSCMICLRILEIKPLLTESFANIFTQSLGCLFILLCKNFPNPNLFLFLFLLPYETDPPKYYYNLYQRVSYLDSLLGVSWFQVFNAFWVYFCIWRECSNLTLSHMVKMKAKDINTFLFHHEKLIFQAMLNILTTLKGFAKHFKI